MINKIILSGIVDYCPRLSLRDILRRQSKTIRDNDKQNKVPFFVLVGEQPRRG